MGKKADPRATKKSSKLRSKLKGKKATRGEAGVGGGH
jgi:hypothetical protein